MAFGQEKQEFSLRSLRLCALKKSILDKSDFFSLCRCDVVLKNKLT